MDLGIDRRVALVLGSGGGIGGGIAEALGAEGVRVACVDLREDAAAACAERITTAGGTAAAFGAELGLHDQEDQLIADVTDHFGAIDILINNTGGPPSTTAAGVALAEWRTYFESMVASVINLADHVLPGMRERRWGRIVTSTSSGVVVPIPMLGISNTLRTALLGWSKTIATEAGSDGVTANVILPGRIASQRAIDMDRRRAEQQGRNAEEIEKEFCARIPAARYGTPREYGDAVAFLASDRASYINGSVLRVDGGMIQSI